MSIIVVSCGSSRYLSSKNIASQASVRINLKDGNYHEGIIVTADSLNLIYVDAHTHDKEIIPFKNIKNIEKINRYFDFYGNPMPLQEIKKYKSHKNTLLYGSAGLFLGAAVGTGIGIGLYALDQPLLANVSIVTFGALGAYYFGKKGNGVDTEEAAFVARKKRYENYKALQAEKQRLEALKRKKQELIKELRQRKKTTK